MTMLVKTKQNANIIPFPVKGAFKNQRTHGKRHWTQNTEFSEGIVTIFARALLQDDLEAVKRLLSEHGQDLATVRSNFFCLPLLIASKYHNIELINLLLSCGACPYLAIHDPRFEYIGTDMQNYLKSAYRFGITIQEKL